MMNPVLPPIPRKPLSKSDHQLTDIQNLISALYQKSSVNGITSKKQLASELGQANADLLLNLYADAPVSLADLAGDDFSRISSGEFGMVPNDDDSADDSSTSTINISADDFSTPVIGDHDHDHAKRKLSTGDSESQLVEKKYKQETEIAVSRILSLGKVEPPRNPHIPPHAPYHGKSVITMTGFGELGRFGNQVLQYMFLKTHAAKVGADIQVPYWVGKNLFGLTDETVERALPAIVESSQMKANSTFTNEFLDYIKASNEGRDVPEIDPAISQAITSDEPQAFVNCDFWGWFQWHTSYYAPYKRLLQDTFRPVAELEQHFKTIIDNKLRQGGKRTVVGLHLRLGDYKNIAASSFGYCAPTSWYQEWLEQIWPTLENPVLFVASDEIDTVLRDFAAYNPVTSDMLEADLPESFKDLGAGFFPDWYLLTQCDVLAISNSSFSFTACMLNTQPNARFFRAHYRDKIVEIDPWNADPIVHREMGNNSFKDAYQTLQILYNTQGTTGVLKNIFYELPYYGIRNVVMKSVLKARSRSAESDALVPAA